MKAQTKAADPKGAVAKQKYELLPISKLKEHPKNPRRGNVGMIEQSIEANNFYGAVIVQKSTGNILVGNHRWKAAKEQGLEKIPAIVIDCDDRTAERILLVDNKTNDVAKYDDDVLGTILRQLRDEEALMGTGYTAEEVDRKYLEPTPPSEFPEFDGQVKVNYCCPKCGFTWS